MGTVAKRSHSIDRDLYTQIEAIAAAEGVSASALLAEGAQMVIRVRRGLDRVAEWEALNGALTGQELADADALLDEAGAAR